MCIKWKLYSIEHKRTFYYEFKPEYITEVAHLTDRRVNPSNEIDHSIDREDKLQLKEIHQDLLNPYIKEISHFSLIVKPKKPSQKPIHLARIKHNSKEKTIIKTSIKTK